MPLTFTPGATRSLRLAGALARRSNSPQVEPAHLLWALVLDESRGAEILLANGVSRETLRRRLPGEGPDAFDPPHAGEAGGPSENGNELSVDAAASGTAVSGEAPLSLFQHPAGDDIEAVLLEARRQAALAGQPAEVGSEHLLCGLAAVRSNVQAILADHGLGPAAALRRSLEQAGDSLDRLPAEFNLSLPQADAAETTDTFRILDAAANRAREGLRVVEDYVRFALDDRHLTSLLKSWRHRLAGALATVDAGALVAARDTSRDVGTTVSTTREGIRAALPDVVTANFKRVQEAARTLEEYGKVLSSVLGRRLEELRYELYTIEKAVFLTHAAQARLAGRNLYVLVSSEICPHGPGPVISAALAAGAGIIQVREKKMGDRDLARYGRLVREWTARAGALFIMNDRPDLAVLADADGVHVGQDELTVREARRIVGPSRLVGASTHTLEQARQAVLDGADYIGVGPVFSSTTKGFANLAGLDFVSRVAAEIALPAYAIGGITIENIAEVVAAGAHAAAVSAAICAADDPAGATRRLLEKLSHGRSAETAPKLPLP